MRTTQTCLRKLFDEAKNTLKAQTTVEVLRQVRDLELQVQIELGKGAMISPYSNNMWVVSWLDGAKYKSKGIPPHYLALQSHELVERIMNREQLTG